MNQRALSDVVFAAQVQPPHAAGIVEVGEASLDQFAALAQLRRFQEAIASYGEVLARRHDNADAHFNRALALLTIGDYRAGFADYEWRWRRTGAPAQKN